MSDENWPAPTPRDEMLARVATRGTRIRAVRGAVNALVILSVVGASAFGIGAAIDGLGEGGGTEVDNIALVPEPPEITDGGQSDPTQTSADVNSTTTASTGDDGETSTTGAATDGTPGGGGQATTNSGSSTTTSAATSTTTSERTTSTAGPTTTGSTTEPEPVTTTTAIPAPVVGTLRTKVDNGIPTGLSFCEDSSAVLAVEIEGAESASVTWNRAGNTRSAEMTAGAFEWSAPIPEIDQKAADVPVVVTVTAIGPGGTTRTSEAVPVADCTPLPSVPSAQGT